VFLTRHFPIFHGGGDTLVAEVLLEKPQAVSGVIQLYGVDSEGVPELVGANVVLLTALHIG
jgi:hypothetical protein